MKKIRIFFYGVIFLMFLGGLFSARTVSSYASMKGVSHSQIDRQIPAISSRPNLRFDDLAATDGHSSFSDSQWSENPKELRSI